MTRPDIAQIGHDNGRLVLRFERRLTSPPALVRQALEAPPRTEPTDPGHMPSVWPAGDAMRWEVDEAAPGSRLVLTTWIDGDDIEVAADAGTAYHVCFERFVRSIDPDAAGPLSGAVAASLAEEYSSAVAAALADTD